MNPASNLSHSLVANSSNNDEHRDLEEATRGMVLLSTPRFPQRQFGTLPSLFAPSALSPSWAKPGRIATSAAVRGGCPGEDENRGDADCATRAAATTTATSSRSSNCGALKPTGVNSSALIALHDADVICGRGKAAFYHHGNIHFRETVAAQMEIYLQAEKRVGKPAIVQSIIDGVHASGGRFLKHNRRTNRWHELDAQQQKDKVSHAIRDASKDLKKIQNQKSRQSKAVEPTTTKTKPATFIATKTIDSELPVSDVEKEVLPPKDPLAFLSDKSSTVPLLAETPASGQATSESALPAGQNTDSSGKAGVVMPHPAMLLGQSEQRRTSLTRSNSSSSFHLESLLATHPVPHYMMNASADSFDISTTFQEQHHGSLSASAITVPETRLEFNKSMDFNKSGELNKSLELSKSLMSVMEMSIASLDISEGGSEGPFARPDWKRLG